MTVIEVAIGPSGAPGVFRVEVVASPAGEASVMVELDADSLLARRGLLQQAVLASAVPSRRVLPETEQPVREAGQVLFAGLLGTGEVAGRYRAAAAVAALRGEGLRVVLRIDTPALAGLPWEAMYDQGAGAYVCRRDQLVRHVPVASVPAPLQVRPPLRILGVVSSPRGLPALDVDKEQDQLARALARPAGQGLAELHWAPTATWADLQDLLLDGVWHVLHFIGHGDFDPGRDEGVLALVREDRRADLVAAHRLTDLLRQARPMPRLVVLNSCSGAAAGASDLFSGTAAALVRGGVSAVAAMQYEISDPAGVAFARGFYAAIAHGRGVDDAASSGRVAILGLNDRTLEWVTPVLYLRGHDTRLFTLPAPTEGRNRADTGMEDTGTARGGQPGDTSPGTPGHGPRRDRPPGQAGARGRQPSAAQGGSGHPPAASGSPRLTHTFIGADLGARPGWRWDVALSFDGAQRDYVEQVAQALQARGVRCFYDADEQIELWGRYLAEELPAIYAEQAAAVVVFVSAEYAAQDWTRLERRAALNRAVRERGEYVLPARFDDTPLPGLLSDMVTVDLRTKTPQQFAAMIVGKLAALAIIAPPSRPDEILEAMPVDDNEAVVYTMRDLNQQTARVMAEIEKSGKPAFITRDGRLVTTITPLGEAVYTMRDLLRQPTRVIAEIEKSGKPAFITRNGRLVTTLTPPSRPDEILEAMPVDDNEAVVYTMRDLLRQPTRVIAEIEKSGKPAFITRNGRLVTTLTPLGEAVYTMRDLNQQTARVIAEIEKSGKPAFITKDGRLVTTITPLAAGQVELGSSRIRDPRRARLSD